MTMTAENIAAPAGASDGKITCHVDGVRVHVIQSYLKNNHPDWTVERYQKEFPGEPIMSDAAKEAYAKKQAAEAAASKAAVAAAEVTANAIAAISGEGQMTAPAAKVNHAFFHEIFELGNAPAAKNKKGQPIQVKVLSDHDAQSQVYLEEIDPNYVFNIDLLKKVIIGFELNKRILLWGFHGTGKSSIFEQAAARTRRPIVRKQHTINMQESDVLGQWTVRDGSTQFQLGPLAMAMIYGWVYLADEYDMAMPSVLAVYQPVMEGKSLLIADAPPVFRKITPHPNFRFCATGNTNGIGDETGLYQGTLVQNAANYSRFSLTEEVKYMDKEIEENILIARTRIDKASATKIVKFGNEVRRLFRDGKITMTCSPRELIEAADIGIAYGGDWAEGLKLAFANRLSRVDMKVVTEYLQRTFGSAV